MFERKRNLNKIKLENKCLSTFRRTQSPTVIVLERMKDDVTFCDSLYNVLEKGF